MIKNIPPEITIYGDLTYRNKKCPRESVEQITFINKLRDEYPDTYGRIVIHPKNEGKRKNGQFNELTKDKAMGMSVGAADIIIPAGLMPFVCEIKRKDHTLSEVSEEQIEYLLVTRKLNAFACIAFGYEAAWEAFEYWSMEDEI